MAGIKTQRFKRRLFGYALVAPALLVMLVFFVWPVILGFITSLTQGFGFRGKFAGFENYLILLTDPRFWNSLKVSILFTLVFILISGGISFLIASYLVRRPKGHSLFLSLLYIPYISTPVIGALLWTNMLSDPFGFINVGLTRLGLDTIPFLKSSHSALLSMIMIQVWYTVGYNCVLFLSGLVQIPESHYEAAELEGCTWLTILWKITLPLIIPTIIFVTTVSTLYGFVNSYVLARLITRGGPFESTKVMMLYIFEKAFDEFDLGLANAATVVTFIIFLGVALLQFSYQKKSFVGVV